ncbi:glyoxalase superfamily protein [Yoonia sp. R2331]|uniref:glyoxalase superfamily protein n=1 Tax=Yoonia sp. R2331 TaxID=3237238 RepID=UPI0034E45935
MGKGAAHVGPFTPILRIFDEAKARAFYVEWLGFEVLFTHRFGPEMPLYLGVIRDGAELHLSEHHGDTTPGTRVRCKVKDIDALTAELANRPYPYLNPGAPQTQDWGERDLTLTDPFGNKITFYQDAG